ncbi:MAG: DUF1343 domain-containing protein [Deltaproteobacteria bacterium]|nr:DUF1343 domain-containing protein [Deltaproteobacteria bacterium]
MASVQSGLDRLAAGDPSAVDRVRGRRVGLVAHPASVTRSLIHAKDVLVAAGAKVVALFGPEHGYGGEAQDMIGVENAIDPSTGAAVHSLYGDNFESLTPRAEWLDTLDALVVDLQDVGSRYYTFVWTAVLCARVCSARGIELIVLDRPNPLGGTLIEGPPQLDSLFSFVGLRAVPVRHGLTLGEAVLAAARDESLTGVSVIRMSHWEREMLFRDTTLPWVAPSPNMPTTDTADVYPGGCLIEGTNLSEGRGTTRPFELFGAPWVDGQALAHAMHRDGGAGFIARPTTFCPTFHKWTNQVCGGVQVHVTDRGLFRPYRVYLAALRALAAHERFSWRRERYEFVSDSPAIDLLTGDASVRMALEAAASIEEIVAMGQPRMARWDPKSNWIY